MRVYFIPFACSLAVRAALNEAGLEAEFVRVRPDMPLPDGRAFTDVSPLGYVPALEFEDGRTLTEGAVILQWIADQTPGSGLAPAKGSVERVEVERWLNLVTTEIHKGIFTALLDKNAPADAKSYALGKVDTRFGYLEAELGRRNYLAGTFSAADFHLAAILNWCESGGVDLTRWPALEAYRARLRTRPSMAQAMAAELPLLKAA